MNPVLLEAGAAAQSGGFGGSGMLMMIVYMVIIFGVMYFLAIRPQKKEQKRMAALINSMEVGDTVVTSSGFYGTLIQVSEEDCIVEFGNNRNCRIPMRKSAIVEVEKASDGIADTAPAAEKK
jgi:preprotein translocase subunit YajC